MPPNSPELELPGPEVISLLTSDEDEDEDDDAFARHAATPSPSPPPPPPTRPLPAQKAEAGRKVLLPAQTSTATASTPRDGGLTRWAVIATPAVWHGHSRPGLTPRLAESAHSGGIVLAHSGDETDSTAEPLTAASSNTSTIGNDPSDDDGASVASGTRKRARLQNDEAETTANLPATGSAPVGGILGRIAETNDAEAAPGTDADTPLVAQIANVLTEACPDANDCNTIGLAGAGTLEHAIKAKASLVAFGIPVPPELTAKIIGLAQGSHKRAFTAKWPG